jgi:hypothetical protein
MTILKIGISFPTLPIRGEIHQCPNRHLNDDAVAFA